MAWQPQTSAQAVHLLAGVIGLTSEAMTAYPWITAAIGAPMRSQFRVMFEAVGAAAALMPIECGAVIMVRQMLLQSDFLILLSPDQVAVELEAGWLVKIADAPRDVTRTIGVTTRADWRATALQRRFLNILTEQAKVIAANP